MKPKKRRLKIDISVPVRLGQVNAPPPASTYMLRLRLMIGGVVIPAGGKGEDDIFIMQDIGKRKPEEVIKQYNRNNMHVVHMLSIPNWEGDPQ